ncbi:MAG: type II secretion system protein [Butyrivibrio sp.]|nr:type II secretion system protein [Butyrivibrio sp.]
MELRERIKKKLNSKAGFSLTEMLLAVIIMLLVSVIVAAGIPAAREAYENVVLASNAEILLSTTISTLRNEVGSASNLDVPGVSPSGGVETGTEIVYYNAARGASSKIFMPSGGTNIKFVRYFDQTGTVLEGVVTNSETEDLISARTATNKLRVTFATVSYDHTKGIVSFTDLSVFHDDDATPLVKRDKFSIKVLSEG